MELEQLHLKTVELLSTACSNWGLPDAEPEDAEQGLMSFEVVFI